MKRLVILSAFLVGGPMLLGAAEPEKQVVTIDAALRAARANHPQLRASHAQTEVVSSRAEEAKAPLLPQVSGTAYYRRSEAQSSPTSFSTTPSTSTSTSTFTSTATSTSTSTSTSVSPAVAIGSTSPNFYSAGLTASELIYDFGQTTGKWKAAKANLRSQQEVERNSAVQVSFNLRSAYYAATAARALVTVASETLTNQEAHLKQIQGFVEAGTHPEIDLAQARSDRANAKVQLINAQVGYETAKAVLNQAMGVEGGTDFEVADPPALPVEGENDATDVLLESALAARPDLAALARQIEAQEFTTGAIKGSYAPSLTASTGLSESGPGLDTLRWGWWAMASLNWQIYGGGITEQQVRESRASTAVLRAQYDSQRQQVRLDIEQARLVVRATKAALDAAAEATANARVRLRLAEGRYQSGVGTIIELGDSQVALTTTSNQEVQTVFNLATARARLLQALGQP
jgi:outer membrane protein